MGKDVNLKIKLTSQMFTIKNVFIKLLSMKKTDVISFLPLSEKKKIELDCLPLRLQLKKNNIKDKEKH